MGSELLMVKHPIPGCGMVWMAPTGLPAWKQAMPGPVLPRGWSILAASTEGIEHVLIIN
jgi:hypothetical protein